VVDVIVQLLKYGLVIGLVVAWASIILPPVVRFVGGRVGRGADSIGSFRSDMARLGGRSRTASAGVGPVLDLTTRATAARPAPVRSGGPRTSARKRRRDILVGLMASTGVLALAGVALGGLAWYAFGLSFVLLAGYVGLLWSIQQAQLERQRKVSFLPHNEVVSAPRADLGRVGTGRA
jgi:hypothetical protein